MQGLKGQFDKQTAQPTHLLDSLETERKFMHFGEASSNICSHRVLSGSKSRSWNKS